MGRKGHIITVFKGTDEEFTGNYVQLADHFGLEYKTLYQRVKDSKLPHHTPECVEDAINKIGYKNKFTVFKGTDEEFTGTYIEIAKHFNIEYYKIIQRVTRFNYTLEEAIRGSRRHTAKHTVYKGTDNEYTGTYTDIARRFNINYGSLYKQIYSGQCLEDAIKYCLRQKHIIYLPLNFKYNNVSLSKAEFKRLVMEDKSLHYLYDNDMLYVIGNQDDNDYTVKMSNTIGVVEHIDFKRGKVKVYITKEIDREIYNEFKDKAYLVLCGTYLLNEDNNKVWAIRGMKIKLR